MYLQSKFRLWAFLPVGLLILLTGLLVVVSVESLCKPNIPPVGVFVFFALFSFIWIWLVFGELRTKVIKVQIDKDQIIVSNYFGLGKTKQYRLSQFGVLETSILPSRFGAYEYLYLMENGKRVIKLSQFYHSNYYDLKNALTDKVQSVEREGFSLFRELKEIFV